MQLRHAMLLSIWTAMACGSRDGEPAGTARPASDRHPTTTAKETRVFEVKSSDYLVNLRAEYMNLWESGFDGVFEVSFAEVPYASQRCLPQRARPPPSRDTCVPLAAVRL